MQWLIELIVAVLRALLPAAFAAGREAATAEDGARQSELRERLCERVRERWSRAVLPLLLIGTLSCVALCGAGCAPRTIYVPAGEPVRLRETIEDAKVWVLDADGKPIAGVMDLPEGWFCLPMDNEE